MRAKLVKEMFKTNRPNSTQGAHYPLNAANYFESSEGDNNDFAQGLTGDELECDVCGNKILPEKMHYGICKRCEEQGFWKDRQDKLHHGHSPEDDNKIPKY
jgi:methionyl-tRNA synthetase